MRWTAALLATLTACSPGGSTVATDRAAASTAPSGTAAAPATPAPATPAASPPWETVPVLVVRQRVEVGAPVTAEDVRILHVSRAFSLDAHLQALPACTVATARLRPGQLLREERLTSPVGARPIALPPPPDPPIRRPAGRGLFFILAAEDLAPGHRIEEDDLFRVEVAPRIGPAMIGCDPAERCARDYPPAIGMVVKDAILSYEPIRDDMVVPAAAWSGATD